MTLADTGPLVALIDASDGAHARCVEAVHRVEFPMLTTWAVLTEAMHFAGRAGGWLGQKTLWKFVERKALVVANTMEPARKRAAQLMETYADQPMDLADATLVALAEERELRRIFTLDADFRVYRMKGRRRFDLVTV